jgi:hypothetical protein
MKRAVAIPTLRGMHASGGYAVIWRNGDGPVIPGVLLLAADAIRLRGGLRGRPIEHAISYRSLSEVRLTHDAADRVQGLPSLLLEVCRLDRFFVAAIGGIGIIAELADQIVASRPLA